MLPARITLLKAVTVSTLSLQLVRPIFPGSPNANANIASPNGLQLVTNASIQPNSSNTLPQQWNGIIALPSDEVNVRLSSPSFSDTPQSWNGTYISTANISTKPHPNAGASLPPLPSGWKIGCSERLGASLDPGSCLEATTFIPTVVRLLSYGPRDAAHTYDVELPKRYLSSDGTCAIEPLLLERVSVAYVKPNDVGIAVTYVIRQCVASFPSHGGVTRNSGGYDALAVRVSRFVPKVVCSPQPYPYDPSVPNACGAIVDQMDASRQKRLFAQQDLHKPHVEVPLPTYRTAPPEVPKCILKVRGNLPRDFGDWYEIWEAANAITAMCVRKGYGGSWEGLGYAKSLVVEMGRVG